MLLGSKGPAGRGGFTDSYFEDRVAIPLTSYRWVVRPEMGEKWPHSRSWPHQGKREKMATSRKDKILIFGHVYLWPEGRSPRVGNKLRIVIAEQGKPERTLPDWVECPASIIVEDILLLPEKNMDLINVFVPSIEQSFIMRVPQNLCTGEFRDMVTKILNVDAKDIKITGKDGKDWTFRTARSMTSSVVITTSSRGGMQNQRDAQPRSRSRSASPLNTQLSPTIPWVPPFGPHSNSGSTGSPEPSTRYQTDRHFPEDNDPPHQLSYPEAVAMAGGLVVTPPRRRAAADEEPQHDLSPRRHLWARAWPESPPPAQPVRLPRPLIVGTRPEAIIHAAGGATVGEVVTEVERELNPWAPVGWQPRGIRYWSEVEHLTMIPPPPIVCLHPVDLRRRPWEPLQPVRTVPVIVRGQVACTVLLPRDLELELAYQRVAQASHVEAHWQLVVLAWDSWIIHSMRLPEEITDMMEELSQLRQRLSRGGLRPKKHFFPDKDYCGDIEKFLDEGKIHEENEGHENVCVPKNNYRAEGNEGEFDINYACNDRDMMTLASVYGMKNRHWAEDMDGKPDDDKHVYDGRDLVREEWSCAKECAIKNNGEEKNMDGNFDDNNYACCARVMVSDDDALWINDCAQQSNYVTADMEGKFADDKCACNGRHLMRRGGMPRQERMDPKSAMIGWALDKAGREAPECRAATVTMLCKAEMRTVMALLNSRSRAQTRQVLEAAYRRCDLPSPFQQQQQQQQQQQEEAATPAAPQQDINQEYVQQLIGSMRVQTQMLASISQSVGNLPDAQQLQHIMDTFALSQQANIEAMRGLAAAVSSLEQKVEQLHPPRQQQTSTQDYPPTPPLPPQAQQPAEEPVALVLNQLMGPTPPQEAPIEVLDSDGEHGGQGDHQQEAQQDQPHDPEQTQTERQEEVSQRSVLEALAVRSQEAQERRSTGLALRPFGSGQ